MPEIYCQKCGNTVLPKDRFCRTCGSSLSTATVAVDPLNTLVQSNREPVNGPFLWELTGVCLGILISLSPAVTKINSGVHHIPSFGAMGGAVGGMAAGMIQAFSWRVPKILKTTLILVLIVSASILLLVSKRGFPLVILVMIPGMFGSHVIFSVTKAIFRTITTSPEDRFVLVLLLVVDAAISIAIASFLGAFGAGLMAQ